MKFCSKSIGLNVCVLSIDENGRGKNFLGKMASNS